VHSKDCDDQISPIGSKYNQFRLCCQEAKHAFTSASSIVRKNRIGVRETQFSPWDVFKAAFGRPAPGDQFQRLIDDAN
jgi:hypothetical protein